MKILMKSWKSQKSCCFVKPNLTNWFGKKNSQSTKNLRVTQNWSYQKVFCIILSNLFFVLFGTKKWRTRWNNNRCHFFQIWDIAFSGIIVVIPIFLNGQSWSNSRCQGKNCTQRNKTRWNNNPTSSLTSS